MYKAIEIGGKRIELTSNAATPRLYQRIFKQDLLKAFSSINTDDNTEKAVLGDSELETIEMCKRLAYVLNMQATKPFREAYSTTDEIDYLEWLSQFEEDDFYKSEVLLDIIGVWQKSAHTTIESKNQVSPQ